MNQDDLKPTKQSLFVLSDVTLALGFLSILGSIFVWATAQERGHRERFGIFIGLWVPSFFILSNRLARKAEELDN